MILRIMHIADCYVLLCALVYSLINFMYWGEESFLVAVVATRFDALLVREITQHRTPPAQSLISYFQ